MRRNIKNLLDRVDQFDDSEELAEALTLMSKSLSGADQYFARECSDHIYCLWDLLCNIKQELTKLEKEKVTA